MKKQMVAAIIRSIMLSILNGCYLLVSIVVVRNQAVVRQELFVIMAVLIGLINAVALFRKKMIAFLKNLAVFFPTMFFFSAAFLIWYHTWLASFDATIGEAVFYLFSIISGFFGIGVGIIISLLASVIYATIRKRIERKYPTKNTACE